MDHPLSFIAFLELILTVVIGHFVCDVIWAWIEKKTHHIPAQKIDAHPEKNNIVDRVRLLLTGSTLTSGDAVELMAYIRMCTKPEED